LRETPAAAAEVTVTSTTIPRSASGIPTKLPVTGIAWRMSRATAGDQIEPTDTTISRIESDPASGAGHKDFRPRVGHARTGGFHKVLVSLGEVAGDNPAPETEDARRLDEQRGKVSTRA
jgi:hypothetical protein